MNMIVIKKAAATLDRTAVDEGVQLQSLTLSEGSIRFEPDVTEYSITVGAGTQRIRVKAVTSDAESTYTVSGYDKLKSGNNDIVITVTDKDGNVGYYYVHVLVEGASDADTEADSEADNEANDGTSETLLSDAGTLGQTREDSDSQNVFEGFLDNVSGEIGAFAKDVSSGDLHLAALGVAGCGVLAALLWIIIFVRHAAAKRRYKREGRRRQAQREAKKKQWELAQTQQDILLKQVDELLEKDREERKRTGYSSLGRADGYQGYAGSGPDGYDEGDYDDYAEDDAGLDDWLSGAEDWSQDEDR